MADNKKRRGKQDRTKIALNEPYELNYFKRKHSITKEQAEKIIKAAKGNRQKANEAAEKLM
ncbi:DUF3606 domain-containing protein [Mesorhizobium sp. M4B.F.Ca.ET.215.01.1.1]|uniref:DUF3606 domain-containing protein n=1 Tax=unclassified Mesorhizobium TaxID=325217 RepID=UPI000FC9D4C6|nr:MULTISPECIES: DUF3606 domain-containing protein [unclassified Mesorhizobium]RUW23069.1 DUF3606 domain-containing protein [Mesorhizobium sp. M4B.F.Ca.ET.013.02.1.1]RVD37251.1 DUF3606 domain-containing protein [Mesorhizobium sp. M4B.F.Ca.ET.019.03.1.1]TGQ15070.1 DUF3606 domain-containing protein [Mesorhizobium sp. M4B.F.Ca.ET.215.01.1.1]TGQ48724.1 DUF3606 domain-containing protein [Mesorhizobium sp. M00.F.Ca.ET.220.01.1.1]TGR11137.1 DUF3606 domain-containing protein [Mesorhizobium sp. M4B.F.C